jgi:hypothetical protein
MEDSLQQAAGNALAVQYNYRWLSKKVYLPLAAP